MTIFTEEEQNVINQAIDIMDSKLKESSLVCDKVLTIKNFLRLQMEHCQREHIGVLYLDNHLRLLEYRVVFRGAVNYCTMSPREIVKDALELNATAIIMAHNHPSGNSEPSRADIDATMSVKKALKLFDIKLVDHFVIGKREITSLVESGLI